MNRAAVEVERLEISGGATDDLDEGGGVDVYDEIEDFGFLLGGADEVSSLENDIGGTIIGARACRGGPEVVRSVAVCGCELEF